jgi:hypothetical protein
MIIACLFFIIAAQYKEIYKIWAIWHLVGCIYLGASLTILIAGLFK